MFQNARYLTKGVQESVPPDIQLLLWVFVDRLSQKTKLDYLQVFELHSIRKGVQILQSINHRQEQPPYTANYLLRVNNPISSTVWIIDDGTCSTMLLPEEY